MEESKVAPRLALYQFGDKGLSWEEIRSTIASCELTVEDSNGLVSSEQKILRYLKKLGYVVLRRGWPDFLCASIRGEHDHIGIFAVEVKDLPGTSELTDHQRSAHFLLQRAGIPVYVVRPEFLESTRRRNGGLSRADRMVWLPTQRDVHSLQSRLSALEIEAAALRRLLNATAFAFEESAASGFGLTNPLGASAVGETLGEQKLVEAKERATALDATSEQLEGSNREPER
jgi:hypothetical protein